MISIERSIACGRDRFGTGAGSLLAMTIFFGTAQLAFAGQSTPQQPTPSGHESSMQRTLVHPVEVGQETFSSAADASEALVTALQREDEPALLKILGADAKDLLSSGDEAEDKEHRAQFVQKYQQMHRLVRQCKEITFTTTLWCSDGSCSSIRHESCRASD